MSSSDGLQEGSHSEGREFGGMTPGFGLRVGSISPSGCGKGIAEDFPATCLNPNPPNENLRTRTEPSTLNPRQAYETGLLLGDFLEVTIIKTPYLSNLL